MCKKINTLKLGELATLLEDAGLAFDIQKCSNSIYFFHHSSQVVSIDLIRAQISCFRTMECLVTNILHSTKRT